MNRSHPFRRLGALVLIATAALALTSACSDDDSEAPGNSAAAAAGGPEPKTIEGAKDMYTTAGKQAISKEDYVKLNTACSRKGLAIQLTSARMEGADKAVVIAKQLVAAQSYTLVYEGESWKLEPAKEGLALYAKGADRAIAAQKKAGTCANA
jgi:hypothetical protein